MKMASDMKGSDLANYVMHRRTIIDLLGKALEKTSDNTYQKERFIHNLIMPMRHESTDIHPDNCNLWLIDERLLFHDFLASDRTLRSMPITSSEDQERPDIAALQVYDNRFLMAEGKDNQYASLSIVEIKRPMRDDYGPGNDDDPIGQVVNYLSRIRKGQVQTASGRPIYKSDAIPGFCYVICDLTPSIIELCENKDATKTGDGLGYIMYQRNLKAYIAIMSFEQVLKVAQERNKSFFDKLGLPTT